jgi:hypothetical protein
MMLPPDVTGPFRKNTESAVRFKPTGSLCNRETVPIAVQEPDNTKNSRGTNAELGANPRNSNGPAEPRKYDPKSTP